jgi:hypothetical protein
MSDPQISQQLVESSRFRRPSVGRQSRFVCAARWRTRFLLLLLLSLSAKSGQRGVMRNAARPLALAFAAVRKGIAAHSHVESALQLSGLSPTTAKQTSDF